MHDEWQWKVETHNLHFLSAKQLNVHVNEQLNVHVNVNVKFTLVIPIMKEEATAI